MARRHHHDKEHAIAALSRAAIPLEEDARAWEPLVGRIGDARFVLVGDATHGTHELYAERARLTQYLIEHAGFDAVAIEADWPDAFRVNRWVRGDSDDIDAEQALSGFERFPAWMWRNTDVLDFVTWLRAYNDSLGARERKVGVYGLDLYSMFASIDAVVGFLDMVDPGAADRARERYACFASRAGGELRAPESGASIDRECQRAATAQLLEIRAHASELVHDGAAAHEEIFSLEQNARVVRNAEEYYRRMFAGPVVTWNLRDRHMADSIAEVAQELDRRLGRACKIVVWEHNSHVGDARATQMSEQGELNVGQLARERYGANAFLIGMTTYEGSVTAATDWDEPAARREVRPALEGSFESVFHDMSMPRFLLLPDDQRRLPDVLHDERLERAIGVVYRPETERASHWFRARMGEQFDAIVHVDRGEAVVPLERQGLPSQEPPETYPFAV